MIMQYFQLCHKPKHLRGILRQPVKPKHSWALLSPVGMFHHETNNGCYVQEISLSWATERLLLSIRDKSHRGCFLKSACNGQLHGRLIGVPTACLLMDMDPQVLHEGVLPDLGASPAALSHIPPGTPFPSFTCSCRTICQALDYKVLSSCDERRVSCLQRAYCFLHC